MLLEKNSSCLLLVDVQEKLAPYVLQPEKLVQACDWLMRLAIRMEIPVLISEQYPRGLGSTVAPLNQHTGNNPLVEKVYFSCGSDQSFLKEQQKINRQQVIISGIETHVCVLQSAIELKQAGADVFVVADAVSARHQIDHEYGLKRMAREGIHLITREMVFFEWFRKAGSAEFKTFSKEFLR